MKKVVKGLFTTPIYYVNGIPHIGHLHTQFLTESIALWWKLKRNLNEERKILISTGTGEDLFFFKLNLDEHGSKIEKEAFKINKNPKEFCDEASKNFQHCFDFFKINYTNFIRTTDKEHKKNVVEVWEKLKKDIYFGKYEGFLSHTPHCQQVGIACLMNPLL
jgi:methionyl-tRNA synthetase